MRLRGLDLSRKRHEGAEAAAGKRREEKVRSSLYSQRGHLERQKRTRRHGWCSTLSAFITITTGVLDAHHAALTSLQALSPPLALRHTLFVANQKLPLAASPRTSLLDCKRSPFLLTAA